MLQTNPQTAEDLTYILVCGVYNEIFYSKPLLTPKVRRSFDSPWSSDSTVLNMNIFKLINVNFCIHVYGIS